MLAADTVTHGGKYGDEGQDRHRVRQRQEQGGGIGREHVASLSRQGLGFVFRSDYLIPHIRKERAAEDTQPGFPADQRGNERSNAERPDKAVDRVGGRRAQASGKACAPTLGKTALNAQQADRSDGRGDAESDDQ
ncbi:hypothetical protein D3C76_1280460 [compost metagenome]